MWLKYRFYLSWCPFCSTKSVVDEEYRNLIIHHHKSDLQYKRSAPLHASPHV